jgi:hypothetical protein
MLLSLICDLLVSNFAFKFNLYRYMVAGGTMYILNAFEGNEMMRINVAGLYSRR